MPLADSDNYSSACLAGPTDPITRSNMSYYHTKLFSLELQNLAQCLIGVSQIMNMDG